MKRATKMASVLAAAIIIISSFASCQQQARPLETSIAEVSVVDISEVSGAYELTEESKMYEPVEEIEISELAEESKMYEPAEEIEISELTEESKMYEPAEEIEISELAEEYKMSEPKAIKAYEVATNSEISESELLETDFMTIQEYGYSGLIHKSYKIIVELSYKGVTIPKGTILMIWGEYNEQNFVAHWYTNLLKIPKKYVIPIDDEVSEISVGIDMSNRNDIHYSKDDIPTVKVEMLSDETAYSVYDDESIKISKGDQIKIYNFQESDYLKFFKREADGKIFSMLRPKIKYLKTYAYYKNSCVRVVSEHWFAYDKNKYEFDHCYKIAWLDSYEIVDSKKVTNITNDYQKMELMPQFDTDVMDTNSYVDYVKTKLPINVSGLVLPSGTIMKVHSSTKNHTILYWYDNILMVPSDFVESTTSINGVTAGILLDTYTLDPSDIHFTDNVRGRKATIIDNIYVTFEKSGDYGTVRFGYEIEFYNYSESNHRKIAKVHYAENNEQIVFIANNEEILIKFK